MPIASRTSGTSLKALREEASHCRACHLWKGATQTVYGEGPQAAQIMLVGDGRPYAILLAVTKGADEKALVQRANAQLKTFPRWARVRHVIATPDPWTVDNGLLTPTQKLKRPRLVERFKDRIERAYREAPLD